MSFVEPEPPAITAGEAEPVGTSMVAVGAEVEGATAVDTPLVADVSVTETSDRSTVVPLAPLVVWTVDAEVLVTATVWGATSVSEGATTVCSSVTVVVDTSTSGGAGEVIGEFDGPTETAAVEPLATPLPPVVVVVVAVSGAVAGCPPAAGACCPAGAGGAGAGAACAAGAGVDLGAAAGVDCSGGVGVDCPVASVAEEAGAAAVDGATEAAGPGVGAGVAAGAAVT